MLASDPELVAASEELLLRWSARGGIVYADVVQMHPAVVLTVESSHVGAWAASLQYDGDAVQLVVPGMKDVAAHPGHDTVAAKWRSNAPVKSAAMACGDRPSIWCRWTKCTTSPSLSRAIDGLLG